MDIKVLIPLDSEKIQNSLAASRNVLQKLSKKQREVISKISSTSQ